jgi:hypothetical protein
MEIISGHMMTAFVDCRGEVIRSVHGSKDFTRPTDAASYAAWSNPTTRQRHTGPAPWGQSGKEDKPGLCSRRHG